MDQNINDTKPLIWSFLCINFRFSGRFSKPTKTSNKDLSHNNAVSFCWYSGLGSYFVTPHYSFPQKTSSCKPHLTQHYKKYTLATQLNTFLTLQIFQKTCVWLVSDKTLALHHFYAQQKVHFQSTWKANVYVLLQISIRKFLLQRHKKFLFGGWGLNDFLKAACCFYLIKCFKFFNRYFWKFNYFSAF